MPLVIFFEARDVIGGGRYLQDSPNLHLLAKPRTSRRNSLLIVLGRPGERRSDPAVRHTPPPSRIIALCVARRLLTVSWTRTRCSMTSFATWASFWRASYER